MQASPEVSIRPVIVPQYNPRGAAGAIPPALAPVVQKTSNCARNVLIFFGLLFLSGAITIMVTISPVIVGVGVSCIPLIVAVFLLALAYSTHRHEAAIVAYEATIAAARTKAENAVAISRKIIENLTQIGVHIRGLLECAKLELTSDKGVILKLQQGQNQILALKPQAERLQRHTAASEVERKEANEQIIAAEKCLADANRLKKDTEKRIVETQLKISQYEKDLANNLEAIRQEQEKIAKAQQAFEALA